MVDFHHCWYLAEQVHSERVDLADFCLLGQGLEATLFWWTSVLQITTLGVITANLRVSGMAWRTS
jgi:hypothetical protein